MIEVLRYAGRQTSDRGLCKKSDRVLLDSVNNGTGEVDTRNENMSACIKRSRFDSLISFNALLVCLENSTPRPTKFVRSVSRIKVSLKRLVPTEVGPYMCLKTLQTQRESSKQKQKVTCYYHLS